MNPIYYNSLCLKVSGNEKKIVFLIFILLLTGCLMQKVHYDYSVNVKNIGENKLQDVSIKSQKGFWHETGHVVKGAVKGIGSPQITPPNDIYTITVKREDGATVEYTLDLRSEINKSFRGWLTFTVNDNNTIGYEIDKK